MTKQFVDIDFSGIKAFKSLGLNVVILSGDPFNRGLAEKRNIPFYYSRNENSEIHKDEHIIKICEQYNCSLDETIYIADDLLDLPALKIVGWPFCVNNSPKVVQMECKAFFDAGNGAISQMLDFFIENGILDIPDVEELIRIDANEHGCDLR